jgi:hypothetical protein
LARGAIGGELARSGDAREDSSVCDGCDKSAPLDDPDVRVGRLEHCAIRVDQERDDARRVNGEGA